jgi:hypothetical protein
MDCNWQDPPWSKETDEYTKNYDKNTNTQEPGSVRHLS